MTTTLPNTNNSRTFQPSFFFWITVIMSLLIFTGFGLTYWQPMIAGTMRPAPPIVHIHGFVFFCWMILLMVQSSLVCVGKVTLHRSIGTFGIAAATSILLVGTLITLLSAANNSDPSSSPTYYDGLYLSVMALLNFGILFCLAIRRVRKPVDHKRLILFATIPLLPPGINRIYMTVFELNYFPVLATYMTMNAIIITILIYDWRTLKRPSSASLIGTTIVLTQEILHAPIAYSQIFASFCAFLADQVYYR
jgi:hypothetical protein